MSRVQDAWTSRWLATSGRARLLRAACLLLAGAATAFAWQSDELQTLRNRGKALFEELSFGAAIDAFARAADDDAATARDYINLAAAQYRNGDDTDALETLDRFTAALSDDPGAPFLRGLIARRAGDLERARQAFERARTLDPTDAAIRYHLGATYAQLGLPDEALAEFQVVTDMGFDVAAQHHVSAAYQAMQILLRQGRREEAEPLVALYREGNARLTPAAQTPGALDLSRWSAITVPASTVEPASPDTAALVRLERAELGVATALSGSGSVAVADFNLDGRQDWMQSGPEGAVWLSGADGYERLALATPDGPVAAGDYDRDGRPDLYVAAASGDRLYRNVAVGEAAAAARDADGAAADQAAAAGDAGGVATAQAAEISFEPVDATGLPAGGAPSHVLWVDFDHDGDLDVLVTHAAGGSPGEAHLLRNQGDDTFVDVSATAGLTQPQAAPDGAEAAGALFGDFDADFDVDLLLWGAGGTTLLTNLRNGRFDDIGAAVGARVETPVVDGLAEDLDNDGRIDLALATADGIVLRRNLPEGTFLPVASAELAGVAAEALGAADFNNDGYLDLVAATDGGLRFFANAGGFRFVPFEPLATGMPVAASPARNAAASAARDADASSERDAPASPARDADAEPADQGTLQGAAGSAAARLITVDADGNGAVDVVIAHGGELQLLEQPGPVASWLAVELAGIKNNVQGVGATVEVKAGGAYQVRPLRRTPLHFGLGGADVAEVVRIRWPNGIIQNLLDAAAGTRHAVTELERLEGSCPFLYTWDGEHFRFINEVLGSSPLGMLLAEGVYHVPDGDEYVFVSGEQLQPRDGYYELRLTEELRETAYIDAVRVLAVDHPEDLAMLPDEGFGGQHRPDLRLHLYDELAPVRVTDQTGRDWSAELAAVDGRWAVPFAPGPYDGLATEHALTLELPEAGAGRAAAAGETTGRAAIAAAGEAAGAEAAGPARVRPAPQGEVVQLYLTGWVYWSMGSVNLAVDQDPSVGFTPVTLEVPDGSGGWRTAIDDIGLPIAKNTTLVVDLTDVLVRDDPRVRLRTTMRLYWDAAAYTVGGAFAGGVQPAGDWQQEHGVPRAGTLDLRTAGGAAAPLRVEAIAPAAAELRPRGFSAVHRTPEGYETFDYHTVSAQAPWEQHRGRFTRFGDVTELLQAADDYYVVLATGDEIAIRVPVSERPLPEGWRRDYLVYLNGWLKDTDVNSMYGDRVGPLPFQGMSSYPYSPSEGYPDDDEHRAFLERYLTRPPRPINVPLGPGGGR